MVEDTEQLERVRPKLTKRKIRVAVAASARETQPQRDAAPVWRTPETARSIDIDYPRPYCGAS